MIQLQERLDRLRESHPFQCYERVRAEVLRMKTAEAAAAERPSAYWREELANIEYLLDASPLVIERLRQHTLHVTGIRAYDYRSGAEEKRALFAEKLAALREIGGDALLVPEPELLGGFGFVIDGVRLNIDTLKFYEALIALERGGVLGGLRAATGRRPVVVEVGPGWGGFAYQLKTLVPDTCYVLVDLPELFLFSGVYLESAFPEARVAFWDDAQPIAPEELASYDFVFVPHWAFGSLSAPHIDLAVNMVSFQEMTTGQVQGYVDRLHELGCPALYSLNRDRSAYNAELTSVREILATRYRLDEIDVLPVPYTKLVTRAELAERRERRRRKPHAATTDHRHVIGRRNGNPPRSTPGAETQRSGGGNRLRAALRRR